MAGDDVTITIRANNGDAVRAFRDTQGHLRDMRGRFVSEGRIISGSLDGVTKSIHKVRGSIIPLATAGVPVMAALSAATLKTAGSAAGAGLAVGVFGAAVAGQVGSLKDAANAQTKYADAVVKSGRGSKQAAEAQRAVQAELASMPQSTARASVALGTLKTTFRAWSDDVADFTMTPVEKSFTVLGQTVPRLTDMAKGASSQLDRLVTVAGGAVGSPGFDAFADRVSEFANSALRDAVDGIIHFTRALSEGEASGPIQAIMEYAAKNGPATQEALGSIGDALVTLAQGAAEAGPGMLTLVGAAAGLVASLPPELVATVMQLAVGLKLVTLAGAGASAVAGGIATLGMKITALQAASAAAGGGMAGLKAAFLSLGTAAKASVVVGGIAVLALALSELSSLGKDAPPSVDKMTTSLGQLAQTGKLSGEAARVFGTDFEKLGESLATLARPSNAEKTQQFLTSLIGMDSTPVENAKEAFQGLDDALTGMVKGGKADLAKAALDATVKSLKKQGFTTKEVTDQLDGYKSALADQALEQELAAQAMGIFGDAAQDTSAKLEAQKGAADGLRASILALNDVNRSAHDAQTQFGEALDNLTASFKEHGATLSADTAAGRANRDAMSAASAAQDELIASGLAAGESLGSMTKKSDELRETMMRLATEAFDGNKAKAREYVNELLGVPSEIKTLIKAEKEEAVAGLKDVQSEIKKTPGKKSVTVDTLNAAAIAALEAVGLKTKQLPNGKTKVYTANGQSLGSIGAVRRALNNLNGKTANTYTKHHILYEYAVSSGQINGRTSKQMGRAHGGRVPKYADGGDVQFAPNGLIAGPGSGTSDSILALFESGAMGRISDTEYVVNAASTRKYLPLLEAINQDRLKIPGFAKGGSVSKAAKGARDEIKDATSGATEKRLLALMGSIAKGHMKMATALSKVNTELGKAKDKLSSLKDAASQLASSVKSGLTGEANITKAAGSSESQVTINTLLSQMTASAANTKQFSSMLKTLKKRGLSKDLLKQIAEAGIEGGGMETAAAILGGGSSEIKTLNKLQGQISKAAGSAGKTTANAVYGAQIKSQEKLVKALDRLADALKAKKKAAGGIGGGLTVVGEEGPELVRLPQGSTVYPAGQSRAMWESMLNQPQQTRRPVGAAGRTAVRPIVVHQTITLDGRVVARQIFDPLREEIAHRGGNVQQSMGRG